MQEVDPIRLSKTLAYLLRHKPEAGDLVLDPERFVSLSAVCRAASKLMYCNVNVDHVRSLVDEAEVKRFEISEHKIRARLREKTKMKHPRCTPPDILFFATTIEEVLRLASAGQIVPSGMQKLVFSPDPAKAWRVAHRQEEGTPALLYIDAKRAARSGIPFHRNRRNGLYMADQIPFGYIMNLQDGFGEQSSAGGIPYTIDENGEVRIALIHVQRPRFSSWEIPKGKLELGEPPEAAALRETREEMGFKQSLQIVRDLGQTYYGFSVPGGFPRLKIVYMYLVRAEHEQDFTPATAEGIIDVQWFSIPEATKKVPHTSLRALMQRVKKMLINELEDLERVVH